MSVAVSQTDLFPLCVAVLQERLVPTHYDVITREALRKMGIAPSLLTNKAFFEDNAEDVREKLLEKQRLGSFYVGRPWCLGALRSWFDTDCLFYDGSIIIPGHAEAGAQGAFEAVMRAPFMEQKNPYARTEHRFRGLSRGLVLQEHVTLYFQHHYPAFFRQASNTHDFTQPARDDFQLAIGNRLYLIDVLGPAWNGEYVFAKKKKPADFHLKCRINGQHCIWEGVTPGKHILDVANPLHAYSPENFLVWLNCHRDGLDYAHLKQCAKQ